MAVTAADTNHYFAAGQQLNMEYVELATSLLRRQLGLTLFGFDVIVEQHTGES